MTSTDELHGPLLLLQQRGRGTACIPPPPAPFRESGAPTSRWTPDRIRKCIATLPAAAAYPDLVERAADILEQWYHRFPLHVWSRFVKFADSGTGRVKQIPKVLKEFNEAAPVLARLLKWVDEATTACLPPVAIIDLCSGFGFLGMFASELLPPSAVEQIYLVDKVWPNRNISGSKGGGITIEHIDSAGWPIPLVTLQIDLGRSREVRDLGRHVLRDPCPTIITGIHLCGTLSLRAIQLFNDGLHSGCGVIGLMLAPCCLPRKQHQERKFRYEVGGHAFAAKDLYNRKANDGITAYESYQKHLLECIRTPEKEREEGMGNDTHTPSDVVDKNVFFFAKAPYCHTGLSAGMDADFGRPVVIEGDNLHRVDHLNQPIEKRK